MDPTAFSLSASSLKDIINLANVNKDALDAILEQINAELANQWVNVKLPPYNATGDGVTDDYAAIQAASDYCTLNNKVLFFPAAVYATSAEVTFENCHVMGYGAVIRPQSSVANGANVGTSSTISIKSIQGLEVSRLETDGRPTDSTGFNFVNVSNGLFIGLVASHNDRGFSFVPQPGTRIAYCTFLHPYIHRNNRSVHIYVDGTGFASENTVIGGRFQMSSVVEVDCHVYAERTLGSASMNHWRWYGVSMESRIGAISSLSAMILKRTSYWFITSLRTEGDWVNSDIDMDANCNNNKIESLYTDGTFSVTDLGTNNIVEHQQSRQGNNITEYFKRGTVNAANPETGTVAIFHRDGTSKAHILSDGTSSPTLSLGSAASTSAVEILWVPSRSSIAFRVGGTAIVESTSSAFKPYTTNVFSLGNAAGRWTEVFATTGTINTSDRDHKEQIGDVPDAVLDAWAEVNYSVFKFKDAVSAKGTDARWHIGLVAQDIKEAFERRGLDATDYGLLCYDEWPETPEVRDDNGDVVSHYQAAGSSWGIRPDECQFLELALMRREINRIKAGQ